MIGVCLTCLEGTLTRGLLNPLQVPSSIQKTLSISHVAYVEISFRIMSITIEHTSAVDTMVQNRILGRTAFPRDDNSIFAAKSLCSVKESAPPSFFPVGSLSYAVL